MFSNTTFFGHTAAPAALSAAETAFLFHEGKAHTIIRKIILSDIPNFLLPAFSEKPRDSDIEGTKYQDGDYVFQGKGTHVYFFNNCFTQGFIA